MNGLAIDIQFTERAKKYLAQLPPGGRHMTLPALQQQPLLPGDKFCLTDVPRFPLLVIRERVWQLGATTRLTIWLDEPDE